jgi:cation transport ATPase
MPYTFHSVVFADAEKWFKRLKHPIFRVVLFLIVGFSYVGVLIATVGIEMILIWPLLRYQKEHPASVIWPISVVVLCIMVTACIPIMFWAHRFLRSRIISIDCIVMFLGAMFAIAYSVWLLCHSSWDWEQIKRVQSLVL